MGIPVNNTCTVYDVYITVKLLGIFYENKHAVTSEL